MSVPLNLIDGTCIEDACAVRSPLELEHVDTISHICKGQVGVGSHSLLPLALLFIKICTWQYTRLDICMSIENPAIDKQRTVSSSS